MGYGSQEENVREYVKENMLLDNYILHGMVSNPYPYIKMADLIVQPSRNEGKSIVLDEAKILGKAIVATNYASVKDQIKDHETGIIVDITPNSIASGIELLMRDKDLKKQIENNCMNEDYAVEEVMKQFYRIIGV